VNVSHAKPLASIRALMVDDEAPARRYLTLLLRRDPDIGSVIECGSGLEAIVAMRAEAREATRSYAVAAE
jgi:hypothetical protein